MAVKAGLGGVDVQTESLVALLAGGIAFDTPGKSEEEAAADHDPEQPHPAESPKHGFLHNFFHRKK